MAVKPLIPVSKRFLRGSPMAVAGVVTDSTYKNGGMALRNRHLVKIKKRGTLRSQPMPRNHQAPQKPDRRQTPQIAPLISRAGHWPSGRGVLGVAPLGVMPTAKHEGVERQAIIGKGEDYTGTARGGFNKQLNTCRDGRSAEAARKFARGLLTRSTRPKG